jgi:hypothetical protein
MPDILRNWKITKADEEDMKYLGDWRREIEEKLLFCQMALSGGLVLRTMIL